MKRMIVNGVITIGFIFGVSGIGSVAIAQQSPLINPGPELPLSSDNIPQIGIAFLPVRHNNGHKATTLKETISLASANNLVGLVRCPAADPNNSNCNDIRRWVPLESSNAYYHDAIIAAVTTVTAATGGETWDVSFTRPSGTKINISPVSFSSNGNCFNLGNYTTCGATSVEIYWYFNGQCAETGSWQVDARNNGNIFATNYFFVQPQVGTPDEIAAKLPSYAQRNYSQSYANICHDPGLKNHYSCDLNKPNQISWTIAEIGCTLTSLASSLSYFGAPVDPPTLNRWLLDHNGYDSNGNFPKLRVFASYAHSRNVNVSFVGKGNNDPVKLNSNICTYGPVPIRVDNNTHTVTAIGRDEALTTVAVLDAADGITKDLTDARYDNQFSEQYVFSGPEHQFTNDQSGLTFTFHSPVEAFVVDPLGRRQGIDPRTETTYNEIPRAFYSALTLIGPVIPSDYEPPKVLDIGQPVEGLYTLTVVGTGIGTYNADFTAYDIALNNTEINVTEIPTALGVANIYQINFSKVIGSKIQVGGGFDGGGQRPKDVNRFLSYANPGTNRTTLPTTTTNYPLLLFYGSSIIPASFNAQLNGSDITALFHPAQGTGDKVLLNLQPGRNVLVLSVDGDVGGRVATDTDRLVFDLQ